MVILAGAIRVRYFETGVGMLYSDFAVFHLLARDISEGHLRFFPYTQNYGGLPLTYLRALVISVGRALGLPWLRASLAFSWFLLPGGMAAAAYWALLRAHSRRAAVFAGLLTACGFSFWNELVLNNDYYPPLLLFTFLLVGVRGKTLKLPSANLSPRALFVLALTTGLALYTNRMCAVAAAAFWLPWDTVSWKTLLQDLRSFFSRPLAPWARALRALGAGLLFLWAYTKLFGSSLGTFLGHAIKTDPQPTFNLALAFLAVLALSVDPALRKKLSSEAREALPRRAAWILGAGFILGTAPEWGFALYRKHQGLEGGFADFIHPTTIQEWGALVASVPQAIQHLFCKEEGFFQFFTLALAALGAGAVVHHFRKAGTLFWKHLAWGMGLSLYIYVNYRQHDPIVLRYIFPIQPFLICAAAAACAELWESRKGWVLILIAGSCGYQSVTQWTSPLLAQAHDRLVSLEELTKDPFVHRTRYVIIDDYHQSHLLSLLTDRAPLFFPLPNGMHDDTKVADLAAQDSIGYLAMSFGPLTASEITLYGRKWCVGPGIEKRFQTTPAWEYELRRCP